jgi:uncharacterized protein
LSKSSTGPLEYPPNWRDSAGDSSQIHSFVLIESGPIALERSGPLQSPTRRRQSRQDAMLCQAELGRLTGCQMTNATATKRTPPLSIIGTSIMWRRLDQPGHEIARLTEAPGGPSLEGTAIFVEDHQPCRLDYRIACDAAWRTTSARVIGRLGDRAIALDIKVDGDRRWFFNQAECPKVRACDDIDLSFSPATNLLPIRRLLLGIGRGVSVRAAWLRFPACVLEPFEQTYERTADLAYRYESGGGAFVAVLEVNRAGFVTRYADLWHEEEMGG